jgi:hypothetical protein
VGEQEPAAHAAPFAGAERDGGVDLVVLKWMALTVVLSSIGIAG